MNFGVREFPWISVLFPDIYPGVELLEHMVAVCLVFEELHIVFYSGCTNLHSH